MSPIQRRILGAAITLIPLGLLVLLVPPLALAGACLGVVVGVYRLIRWGLQTDHREREVRLLEQSFGEGWNT